MNASELLGGHVHVQGEKHVRFEAFEPGCDTTAVIVFVDDGDAPNARVRAVGLSARSRGGSVRLQVFASDVGPAGPAALVEECE